MIIPGPLGCSLGARAPHSALQIIPASPYLCGCMISKIHSILVTNELQFGDVPLIGAGGRGAPAGPGRGFGDEPEVAVDYLVTRLMRRPEVSSAAKATARASKETPTVSGSDPFADVAIEV